MSNRWFAPPALLAAGVLAAALSGLCGQEKKESLPADLDAVPRDALYFATVRLGDLWSSDAAKPLREQMAKEAPEVLRQMEADVGVPPEEVERLTMVVAEPQPPLDQFVVVGTTKPFDRAKVLERLVPGAKEEKVGSRTMYVGNNRNAVHVLGDRAYVIGRTAEVRRLLEGDRAEGPFGTALKSASAKHAVVAAVNVKGLSLLLDNSGVTVPDAYKPLLKATAATAVADLEAEGLRVESRLVFPEADDAKAAHPAAKELLQLATGAFGEVVAQAGKDANTPAVFNDVLQALEGGLKESKLKLDGSQLTLVGSARIAPKAVGEGLGDAVTKVRIAAARNRSANNLKQLALAMHAYHDVNGHFPPAAVYGKDGKPLLSWRVLVLPYLENEALYKEFHLDEPWDSDHNKKLLEKMPEVFASPVAEGKKPETPYQAFVGKDTVFPGAKGIKLTDITDGTSNTILFVEAPKSAPWTKPDDLPYDAGKPLPKVGGLFPNGFNAVFCDGSVRFIVQGVNEKTLRALITPAGGEVVEDF